MSGHITMLWNQFLFPGWSSGGLWIVSLLWMTVTSLHSIGYYYNLNSSPASASWHNLLGSVLEWKYFFTVICHFQVLICRNYKGDVDMAEIDHFMPLLMQHEEEGLICPVVSHGNVHFMWIKHSNLFCILDVQGKVFSSMSIYALIIIWSEIIS